MDNPVDTVNQAQTTEYIGNGVKKNGRKLEYYYDSHPTKEDLMSHGPAHSDLIIYLENVLEWNFSREEWTVMHDVGIYQTPDFMEYPLAPDISVFDIKISEVERRTMRSWRRLEPNRPAPTVVFEVSSKETWDEDIKPDKKPEYYRKAGMREYFAYDPQVPTVWRKNRKWVGKRLMGWRYDAAKNIEEIKPDARGWLYSQELNIWLQEDESMLRLYDVDGNLLLTEGEAEHQRAEEEHRIAQFEKQRADRERQRAETERQRAKEEREKANLERQRAEEERQRAEEEQQKANLERQRAASAEAELQALLEKLKAKGIDPDAI
jgi:Uma2 family endonuclease